MTRPRWTLSEAAERVGASRSTLRRRLEAGAFPSAYRDTTGIWHIPLEDLLAAGFSPAQPVSTSSVTDLAHSETEHAHELAQRLQAAEIALSAERAQRLAAAQVAAAERRRADSLEMALRLLGPAPTTPEHTPPASLARRSWWHRGSTKPTKPAPDH